MKKVMVLFAVIAFMGASAPLAVAAPDGAEIYLKRCKMCHDLEKKKMAVAVKTMTGTPEEMRKMIVNGRKMMPKFGEKLSAEEIDAVVTYFQSLIVANPCAANPCAANPCAGKNPCAQ